MQADCGTGKKFSTSSIASHTSARSHVPQVNEALKTTRLEAERAAEAQKQGLHAALQVAQEGLEASRSDLKLKTDVKLEEVGRKTDAVSLDVDTRWA